MPIEIRELIIKTEIVSSNTKNTSGLKEKDLSLFKKQVLQECKRLISGNNLDKSYKR